MYEFKFGSLVSIFMHQCRCTEFVISVDHVQDQVRIVITNYTSTKIVQCLHLRFDRQ